MSVTGKVILITGAARGLGLEYANSLGAAGAHIVGGDVLDFSIAGSVSVKLDVTDMASVEAMVAAALNAYGRIDGLVNNAALYGSLRGGRFNQIPEQDWDAAMTVNVKGIWNCCKAVVPAMLSRKQIKMSHFRFSRTAIYSLMSTLSDLFSAAF